MNKESRKVRFPIKNEVKKVRFSDLAYCIDRLWLQLEDNILPLRSTCTIFAIQKTNGNYGESSCDGS